MTSHRNPMVLNLQIPSFVEAFLGVRRWVKHYAPMQFSLFRFSSHAVCCISSGATMGAKGTSVPPLAKSIRKLNPKYKRLNQFCTVSKRAEGAGQFNSSE